MEAVKKVLDLLPLPFLVAIAVLAVVAWVLKEIRSDADYGPALRDARFRATLILCCLALVVFYTIQFIVLRDAPFGDAERGILVARFSNDEHNTVGEHTLRSLEERIYGSEAFENVKFRLINTPISDESEISSVVSKTHAIATIWGSFVSPNVVHYRITWSGSHQGARLSIKAFPDIKWFEDQFMDQLKITPSSQSNENLAFNNLNERITTLVRENDRLRALIRNGQRASADQFGGEKPQLFLISVGINQYENVPALAFAESDADAIAQFYKGGVGFWQSVYTITLVGHDATRDAILSAVKKLAGQAKPNDSFIFYFSGHGASDKDDSYLLPANFIPSDIKASGLTLDQIGTSLAGSTLKRAALFIDAALAGGDTVRFNYASGWPPQSVVLTAAFPGQFVVEDFATGHGLFTGFLLDGLRGAADVYGKGFVRAFDLYSYVDVRVRRQSPGTKPMLFASGSVSLDLLLAPSTR
jgi:Caspase domain